MDPCCDDVCDVVFVGNPGVGKSTLLSAVSGRHFESGLSWVNGLTKKLCFQRSPALPGVRFGDTPGLADVSLAEMAAQAINEAFSDAARHGRNVKLIFVITTESGRLRPEDLFTIKQVMQSIELPGGSRPGPNSYGLLINKCNWLEAPIADEGKQLINATFQVPKQSVPFVTGYTQYVPFIPEAAGADQLVHFPGLIEWVFSFPGITISRATLIDTRGLEEKMKQMRQQAARDEEALVARLQRKHEQELGELKAQMDSTVADMERKLREAQNRGFWKSLGKLVLSVASIALFRVPLPP
ncbi:unnamed protein product [Symbiodinium sp. CCMP2456]|nr:unnamed protein product [Symbiodinium sp. CCMP2456]